MSRPNIKLGDHVARDLCEDLMRAAVQRLGRPWSIDFFGDQWRIWWRGWKVHDGATCGDLSGYGPTLVDAITRALLYAPKAIQADRCPECAKHPFD